MAWNVGTGPLNLVAQLVGTDGSLILPQPLALGIGKAPAIASDGTNFVVVSGSYAWRIDGSGDVLDTDASLNPDPPTGAYLDSAAVAFGATEYAAVGRYFDNGNVQVSDIYAERVSPTLALLDASQIVVSTDENSEIETAAAFDGASYLVVWSDDRSGADTPSIWGARLSTDGTVLDPMGIGIGTAVLGGTTPSVTYDGSNFVVSWVAGFHVYAARVSPAGVLLDTSPIVLDASDAAYVVYPVIAGNGAGLLALWCDSRNLDSELYATRIAPNGAVLDPDGIHVGLAGTTINADVKASLALAGSNYLAAWPMNGGAIVAARISAAGTVLDTTPIQISAGGGSYVAMACGAANCLVTWADVAAFEQLDAARVAFDGTVLDPGGKALLQGAAYQTVAWDGQNYVITHQLGQSDAYGMTWVDEGSLSVVGSQPLNNSQTGVDQTNFVASAGGPPGSSIVTYTSLVAGTSTTTRAVAWLLSGDTLMAPDAGAPPADAGTDGGSTSAGTTGAGGAGATGTSGSSGGATTGGTGGTTVGGTGGAASSSSSSGPSETTGVGGSGISVTVDKPGCGCRLDGRADDAPTRMAALLALGLLLRRRPTTGHRQSDME